MHPSVPANSAQEFVQLARTAREPVTYGSWNVGSSGQVLAESVKAAAGINMLHVPFQGTAPLMTALIGGQIKAAILPIPLVEQYAKAGTIRLGDRRRRFQRGPPACGRRDHLGVRRRV